jgi:hypothetical protein
MHIASIEIFTSTFFDHLQVTDPSGEFGPSLMYYWPPLVRSSRLYRILWPQSFLDGGLPQGYAPDPSRGSVLFDVKSCGWASAPGVVVEIPSKAPETRIWNARNIATIDPTLTETDAVAGVAIAYAPEGPLRIQAKRKETHEPVADVTVWVRKGAATYFDLPPTPMSRRTINVGRPAAVAHLGGGGRELKTALSRSALAPSCKNCSEMGS